MLVNVHLSKSSPMSTCPKSRPNHKYQARWDANFIALRTFLRGDHEEQGVAEVVWNPEWVVGFKCDAMDTYNKWCESKVSLAPCTRSEPCSARWTLEARVGKEAHALMLKECAARVIGRVGGQEEQSRQGALCGLEEIMGQVCTYED